MPVVLGGLFEWAFATLQILKFLFGLLAAPTLPALASTCFLCHALAPWKDAVAYVCPDQMLLAPLRVENVPQMLDASKAKSIEREYFKEFI